VTGNLFQGVLDVAFSPDGSRLATAGADGLAKMWDAATGRELLTLIGHTDSLYSLAFSPDGRYIATSSDVEDTTVKVWDAQTGEEIYTLAGHVARVWGLAFSPDSCHAGDRRRAGDHQGLGHGHRAGDLHGHRQLRPYRQHRLFARRAVLPDDRRGAAARAAGRRRRGRVDDCRANPLVGQIQPGWPLDLRRRCGRPIARLRGASGRYHRPGLRAPDPLVAAGRVPALSAYRAVPNPTGKICCYGLETEFFLES
jgi:hypothetical protein